MAHPRILDRALRRPLAELTPFAISGDLPPYSRGQAYEGRVPFTGEIGDVAVVSWSGNLPAGATVTIDNATDELVVAWPAYQAEDIEVPVAIPNGFFDAATGWQLGAGWSISGGAAYYYGQGIAYLVSETRAPCEPGRVINISCDVYQGASSAGACGGAVELIFFDADKNEIAPHYQGTVIATSDGPTLSSLTATAPEGTAFVSPAVMAWRWRQNREMHVDNVQWDHTYTVGGDGDETRCLTATIIDSAGRTADYAECIEAVPAIEDAIIADNPTGYWKFNETVSGAAAVDYSGNGRHLTVTTTDTTRALDGVSFASYNGGANLADGSVLGLGDNSHAMECVITQQAPGGGAGEGGVLRMFMGYIVDSTSGYGTELYERFGTISYQTAQFTWSIGVGITPRANGERMHLMAFRIPNPAGTSSPAIVEVYKNGVLTGVYAGTQADNRQLGGGAGYFNVGGGGGGFPGSYGFVGKIAHVATYGADFTARDRAAMALTRAQAHGLA